MIEISDGERTVLLNGVAFVDGVAVKTEDGAMVRAEGCLIRGGRAVKLGQPFLVTTDKVRAFLCVDVFAAEGSIWDITGTVIPVGSVVHLGDASKFDPSNPTNGEIAAVESDETGYFEFLGVGGLGTLNLWVDVPPTMAGYASAYIGHETTLVSLRGQEVLTAYAGAANPEDWGQDAANMQSLEITISGECPAGSTVYISRGNDTQSNEELAASVVSQAATENTSTYSMRSTNAARSTYSAVFSDHTVGSEYVAWCKRPDEGTEGELTATMENLNVNEAVCLSGDTQITLADGSTKRMDSLTDDDVLLSGDGKPVKIVKRKRGTFNSRHTYYTFEDGTVIDEVHAHRFFNVEQGFWQRLDKWKIGEHAKRQDGETVALVSVDLMDERAEMFGVWTESHDYWANGLLSGEAAANQSLLADATAEQAANMVASVSERWIAALSGLGRMMP